MLKQFSPNVYVMRLVLVVGLVAMLFMPVNATASLTDKSDVSLLDSALSGDLRLDDPTVRQRVERMGTQLTTRERQTLTELYHQQIIANVTDLEGFARIVEFDAALTNGDVETFMLDISRLTLDATSNWDALFAGPWGRLKQHIHARMAWFPGYEALGRFGSTGFAADDGGNQAQHVWYSVAIAYKWGATVAGLEAQYHEWNPPGLLKHLPGTGGGDGSEMDLALSRHGIELGRTLADGTLQPRQVAGWMRETLGIDSATDLRQWRDTRATGDCYHSL